MKTLKQIEEFFQAGGMAFRCENSLDDRLIGQLHLDSRGVEPGDAFIALQGTQKHGLAFLAQVLDKQPGWVLSDRPLEGEERSLWKRQAGQCVFCWCEHLTEFLAALADWFYDSPSRNLKVVGITGTNGKTSSAFYTVQLLEHLGFRAALIGTLGNGNWRALTPTQNTTPDVVSVQRLLAGFLHQGYEWVVMEVSSHALSLGRVDGVCFQTTALTQITRDHLDFHGSVESYREAKKSLFTGFDSTAQVLNLNDETGRELCESNSLAHCFGYAIGEANQQVQSESKSFLLCRRLQLYPEGMLMHLHFAGVEAELKVSLLGRFNAENVLCALSVLLANGFAWPDLVAGACRLKPVDGRMQRLCEQPAVVLDFAHTADALHSVLLAVREHLSASRGKLWVLFGCGGNRDKGKRPLMAQVAEQLADRVVVTSDNPRDERPDAILDEICEGFSPRAAVTRLEDRAEAIEWTLQQADDDDLVVVAGKGHEAYQEIAGNKYPFSDAGVVKRFCRSATSPKTPEMQQRSASDA
ncbi:UDP-N-acetylmuramoyl-L-alanyl-D-glutamate--2,6-diaminopimelate ligase [Thiomicrorhabdus sp.]|uniref:UDP-N-acetylmuramoyl-L-alanyl-D-glutamate--2, 6-diaminopimelate ligase n=1 Tax=Thiomicrorhabdus sp. TaxID=2039724 RepID=UPI0029C727EA|nr:UDP-N-acetylmuramoyl-L-alanyl-D-glutamate--2,6-diaminopimelate ligase [Thiomicrorhabdus sp.]